MRTAILRAGILVASLVGSLVGTTAGADVVHAEKNGFETRASITLPLPAHTVWARFSYVSEWWDSHHTISGDALNLSLDMSVGGCLCEKLPADNGHVQHGVVTHVEEWKLLRLRSELGPLGELAVTGVLTFTFAESKDGKSTTVTADYRVGGWVDGGADQLAKPVDSVLTAQLQRFRDYAK